jgi:hypothetical protein
VGDDKKKDQQELTNPFLHILLPNGAEGQYEDGEDTGLILDPDSTAPEILLESTEDKRQNSNGRFRFITGHAVLYNMDGKIVSRAALRNLSADGAGLELTNVQVNAGDSVIVEFSGHGLSVGPVKSVIQWVTSIEGHPHLHKLIGIRFTHLNANSKKAIQVYFEELKKMAHTWDGL